MISSPKNLANPGTCDRLGKRLATDLNWDLKHRRRRFVPLSIAENMEKLLPEWNPFEGYLLSDWPSDRQDMIRMTDHLYEGGGGDDGRYRISALGR